MTTYSVSLMLQINVVVYGKEKIRMDTEKALPDLLKKLRTNTAACQINNKPII